MQEIVGAKKHEPTDYTDMLQEGLVLDNRYKFVKLLGRGGFAEVWLADDLLLEEHARETGISNQVAVKVYMPGGELDENGVKIFTQEFAGVFDVNHTNLLTPTYYGITEKKHPYLIMPYIKNGSAFQYVAEGRKMPEDECWKMLHDVAAGLACLHEKTPPMIHQDIKPDNIMISDEGHYLITDFGISVKVRNTIRNAVAAEQSAGTLAYMGPERFSATPQPMLPSDIWSFGAMMFELMTGLPPFGNHGGLLQKNGADIPILEGNYSQELKDIVYRCLAKEPWDRPSARDIEELAYNRLHGIVPSGKKKEVKVNQNGDSGKRPAPKPNWKKLLEMIAGVVAVILVLIVVFMCSGNDETPQPVETEPVIVINYDSLAQIQIQEGVAFIEQADTFVANHEADKYDTKYSKVEETYIGALKSLEQALENKDSLSASIVSDVTAQMSRVRGKLLTIYNDLKAGAQYVPEWDARAEDIRPYISDMIENETKNDNNNDNN